MAFTGTAAIKQIADNLFRITGLSLAAAATGTIGLVGGTGDVDLPAPTWDRYNNALGQQVELDESIQVSVIKAEAGLSTTEAIAVVKTGDGPTDFLATLSNPDAAASGALEIYVRFH